MSLFSSALLWFGAALSITEFLTGSYYAPLGLGMGLVLIIVGHILGGILLFAIAYVGAKENKTAMETVSLSFGHRGQQFFSILNVLQLFGWTAIMIYQGALAAETLWPMGMCFWSLLLGSGIIVWLQIYRYQWAFLHRLGMILLFLLLLCVLFTIANNVSIVIPAMGHMSITEGLELAIAMPISWLPLICDYTKNTKTPMKMALVSSSTYCVAGAFMYSVGLIAVLYAGEGDIPVLLMKAGYGLGAILIILFATITTTFLDAYSAGISAMGINTKIRGQYIAYLAVSVGVITSIIYPLNRIESFLYLLGSVFAPMAMIILISYFLFPKASKSSFLPAFMGWALGFASYHYFLWKDLFLGATIPSLLVTVITYCLLYYFYRKFYLKFRDII